MILWAIFAAVIIVMLALDLGIFQHRHHEIKLKEALLRSAAWIGLALIFCLVVYFWRGPAKALEFLTGYLIEESLSVDNLFVFLVVFAYFRVPRQNEHEVLFWGIMGALVTRGIFIVVGVELIHRFHWVLYIFGLILIWTAIKLAFEKGKEIQPDTNPVLKIFSE